MSDNTFDAITRQAAASVSRRASMKTLGGAALAATLAAPSLAKAGKAGEKARKRCKRQAQQCRNFYDEFCQDNPACEEDFFPCCEFLGRCNARGYLECFHAIT
jgi:hypothetical protein